MPAIRFKLQDVPDGGMTAFTHKDERIIVLRDSDELTAFEGSCPHAGADLSTGLICENRLICPWHHATFDTKTGALLEPVATRGLKRYAIQDDGDEKVIHLDDAVKHETIQPQDIANQTLTLIIGSGAVGFMTATWLRTLGYGGTIKLYSKDRYAPYKRPLLSKNYFSKDMSDEELLLGGADWAKDYSIELHLDTEVTQINPKTKPLYWKKETR